MSNAFAREERGRFQKRNNFGVVWVRRNNNCIGAGRREKGNDRGRGKRGGKRKRDNLSLIHYQKEKRGKRKGNLIEGKGERGQPFLDL